MKKYFILLLAIGSILLADDYILSGQNVKLGGFGGPRAKMMNIDGKSQFINGGGGSITFSDSFSLGVYGYGDFENDYAPYVDNIIYMSKYTGYGYAGIYAGYSMQTDSVFQPTINIGVGYGATKNDAHAGTRLLGSRLVDTFSLIEANIGVQIKILPWFRIYPYAGYTMTTLQDNSKYENEDFSGINYGIEFNFGKWRK